MREAGTAASLSHPNIIPVYAVKQVDDLVFFVMKHIEGSPLSAIIKQNGALPVPTAISILRQLASGLDYAHQRGVIHRDIKPANIMIDQEGWAVLADFGIAKVSDGQEITATGAAIGTPCYMSPEQCSGVSATMAADQYSLGVVAYEMLTGSPPFLGDSVASVITKHLFETPPAIEDVAPECPHEISRVDARMLAKNPDERYASIKDALLDMGDEPGVGVDSGRAHMIELANSALASSGDIEYSTPRSPNAFARNSAERVLTTTGGKPEFRRWMVQRTLAAVGVVAVSLIVSLAVGKLTGGGSSAPVPTVVVGQPQPIAVPSSPAATEPTTPPPSQPSVTRRQAGPNRSNADEAVRTSEPSTVGDNAQPMVAAAEPSEGQVLLGIRGVAAVLYVNGEARGVMEGLNSWPVPAGTVRLSVRAEGCVPWDSAVVVRPGEQTRVGYRQPQCSQ
jgi:serine/threonine protein kinase